MITIKTGVTTFNGVLLEDLKARLDRHDADPLECDGMTHIVSHTLYALHIDFQVYAGVISGSFGVIPHLWIELFDDQGNLWIIDYRLQMWMNTAAIPKGLFPFDSENLELVQAYQQAEPIEWVILPSVLVSLLSAPVPPELKGYLTLIGEADRKAVVDLALVDSISV